MAGKAPYIREQPRMKCFLEVIVHWRMIIWLFTYAMSPVNAKKPFPLQFCEILLFRIAWKTTSCERKNFFAIYGSFCEIGAFPLGVFSIRNFNLYNLKGNGNAATLNQFDATFLLSFFLSTFFYYWPEVYIFWLAICSFFGKVDKISVQHSH